VTDWRRGFACLASLIAASSQRSSCRKTIGGNGHAARDDCGSFSARRLRNVHESENLVSANAAGPSGTNAPGNELTDNPNGTQTLRLEGNDSATFVDGELVDVNRAD
jgi:hypothetical protein